MKSFIKSYGTPLILLVCILLGGIVGVIMGPDAQVFEPLGQIFLIFTLIVPLVFFVLSSIANMGGMGRLGKIMLILLLYLP